MERSTKSEKNRGLREWRGSEMLSHPVTLPCEVAVYVKLFGSILDSSIWSTDLATRVVWITMLTMADEYGIVYASVDGLANRARISIPECERALAVLSNGDKHSRTKNDRGTALEGRRVEAVDGGWQVINYQKYRELRSRKQIADAVRQARHRENVRRDEA